jgi:hydrogenase maturation protease
MNMNKDLPPILVLGVGNLLMKDEGLGVHTVQKLSNMPLPPEVEVLDGGTMGLELLNCLENRDKVILIDVVNTDEPPGTLFRFTTKEILQVTDNNKLSFHQLGFFDIIKVAQMLDKTLPEIVIIAVQPKEISMGMELTPELDAKLPAIIELVLKEIP